MNNDYFNDQRFHLTIKKHENTDELRYFSNRCAS